MPSFLTQCPHCLTPFRVTDAQLAAADGLVRCGACLGVFSAAANRITVKPTAEEAAALAASEEADEYEREAGAGDDAVDPEPAQAEEMTGEASDVDGMEDVVDMDEVEQEEDQVEEEEEEEEPYTEEEEGEEDAELVDLEYVDIPLGDLQLDIEEDSGLEEEFAEEEAEEDLEEDPEEDLEEEGIEDDEDPTDYEDEAEAEADIEDEGLVDEIYEEYLDEQTAAPDEPDVDDEPQAEEFEPEFSFEDEELPDANEETAEEETAEEEEDPVHLPRQTATGSDKAAIRNYLADIDDDEALDPIDDAALDELDEPVLLDAAPRRSRLASMSLLLANLALVTLLLWQFAAANIEWLSRSTRFAPYMPYACRVLDCPAPQRSQPELFVSEQLLVRSHPRYAEALEVSLVFRNDALEAQPFPALELGLHDTGNRLLANRLFQPTEYLPAELHTSEMPAQSSLQVTLELLDPGSEAVNYSLTFRAP